MSARGWPSVPTQGASPVAILSGRVCRNCGSTRRSHDGPFSGTEVMQDSADGVWPVPAVKARIWQADVALADESLTPYRRCRTVIVDRAERLSLKETVLPQESAQRRGTADIHGHRKPVLRDGNALSALKEQHSPVLALMAHSRRKCGWSVRRTSGAVTQLLAGTGLCASVG